ncbi:MAG: hypothetical protein ACLGIJ_01395 [Candidatus Limnocylindria bacterium]
MSTVTIRPRASIVDADRARTAVVDLPLARVVHRPHTPSGLARTIASLRRSREPERTIVVTLSPVAAAARR